MTFTAEQLEFISELRPITNGSFWGCRVEDRHIAEALHRLGVVEFGKANPPGGRFFYARLTASFAGADGGHSVSAPTRNYREETYLFPLDSLLAYSAAQLRDSIDKRLPTALAMIDGSSGSASPVQVDYAQDLIEQARDLLLDLGEVFTVEEVESMPFLRWPSTTTTA